MQFEDEVILMGRLTRKLHLILRGSIPGLLQHNLFPGYTIIVTNYPVKINSFGFLAHVYLAVFIGGNARIHLLAYHVKHLDIIAGI